ncbi:MAG TPA: TatD family hydrolase [Gemmatimonadales bacterium]|nr:TatD family hydrolase [Gemmatimonadales bacterium]
MLIDTHCHLADAAYAPDRAQVLDRAWAAGVGRIVVIGESRAAAEAALALAEQEPRLVATAGVHPHHAGEWDPATEGWLRDLLSRHRIVAVGETGLDFHYDHASRAHQHRAFEAQLALAAQFAKPAVIHARDADDEVAAVLANHSGVTAILHSFSSGMGLLRAGLVHRHYVSFSGMVTFKNWRLDDAIRETPLDRLLLETDGPCLAPVPHRGKRNEPGFVGRVAERVAAVKGLPVEELVAATGQNASRVFQWAPEADGKQ